MNKYIAGACLALIGSTAAQAQSSLTLYGVVDAAVEHLTNANANGDSLTRMPGFTGSAPSRFGLRGSEDLGNGLRAGFTLESGFGPDAGTQNQGGRLFGRQAFVSLSSNTWGTVMLGRQYTMLFYGLMGSDILGPNNFGSGSVDVYIPNARVDNAIGYMGKFGALSVGATYSFGRDAATAGGPSATNCGGEIAGDSSACREWSAMVKYDTPTWGASFAIDEITGGAGSWVVNGLTNSDLKDRRINLGAYAKVGTVKIGAGLLTRKNDGSAVLTDNGDQAKRSDIWYVGAAYPVTPKVTVDGQVFHLKYKDSANKSLMFAVRGTYALSKRTAVYASAGSIDNSGTQNLSVSNAAAGATTVAGGNQLGFATGIRHSF